MPARRFPRASPLALLVSLLICAPGGAARAAGTAQAKPAAPASAASSPVATDASRDAAREAPQNSRLDAPLFYQLLIGEMELRSGQAGAAYDVILDAARKSRDEQLFRRATDIAIQARAGEQALVAARAWRQAWPQSLDAARYEVQLLVALNHIAETADPLRALLELTPMIERPAAISALPAFYARAADRQAAAAALEQVLPPYAAQPGTRTAANVALGRAYLAAQNTARALEYVRRAHAADTAAEGPALLALELMQTAPDAEAIVLAQLAAKPDNAGLRVIYARVLAGAQRYGEAAAQLDIVTRSGQAAPAAWLTLGALQLELRRPQQATAALQEFVRLIQAEPAPAEPAEPATSADEEEDVTTAAATASDRGLTQAWLMLAQAAELQGDYKAAESWLARIDNPQRALDVQTRRASLLAKQGKLKEARELIRKAPAKSDDDVRAKVLAEAQLLRDAKQWTEAHDLLAEANRKMPDDVDLLYEQSMMDEKLNRMDEMERLLRRVIALKPDHQHAYNALGYSLAERNLRLPEAKALIQRALELSPGEPFITDSLGWVEYRIGNRDEALRLLRGAYRSRPDAEIAAHLGEVLWVSGQRDEARRVWREGRSRDAANDVLRETLARLRVDL